jgi:hypothetical protein
MSIVRVIAAADDPPVVVVPPPDADVVVADPPLLSPQAAATSVKPNISERSLTLLRGLLTKRTSSSSGLVVGMDPCLHSDPV